ncbi:MAG: DUF2075 domain-containing protein [Bacteroidales bacterium]|nr:DUF2075 domain-containing protein [Bacteroidales bacterium]
MEMYQHRTVITDIPFNKNGIESLKSISRRKPDDFDKWPVVYIIDDGLKKYAYVGETTNIQRRMDQHLGNTHRKGLTIAHIIHNHSFNKSVILDLEAFLINYMHADGQFVLQNGNGGQHCHYYYDRDDYKLLFKEIWASLRKKKLVSQDLSVIENSDLFKYSPFKTLTQDQYDITEEVLKNLSQDILDGCPSISIINGGAGTGKSILGVFLVKLLVDSQDDLGWSTEDKDLEDNLSDIAARLKGNKKLKIAYVVPMQGFRKTISNVFKSIKGLKSSMVLSPADVANSKELFDILIVDEAHRLRRRFGLSSPFDYHAFDKKNKALGCGEEGTELDWILKKSRHQILFYDSSQSIKPADIQPSVFSSIVNKPGTHSYQLTSQLRCKGGDDYIDYVNGILSCTADFRRTIEGYDFRLFEDVQDMFDAIKEKESVHGLCRMIAGYAWDWATKGKRLEEIKAKGIYDIDIDGYHYVWNTTDKDWINSENSINEIGCIHTTQGFDLNYAGIIIGPEFTYDPARNEIIVIKELYKDGPGKFKARTGTDLKEYILNIYKTLLARGILGTYVYACDPCLQEYLRRFIPVR